MRPGYKTAVEVFRAHHGVLRASQARQHGIDPQILAHMLRAGLLVKETRGIYRLASSPPLNHPDLALVALRAPRAVICLISALDYHGLTTQIPHRVYIALPRGASAPRIEHPPIAVTWLGDKSYQAGIEDHLLDGIIVRIYSREKTITDCFKFRNKVGLDVALEALKAYLALPDRNINELFHYAKINRVANVIRPYLEATA